VEITLPPPPQLIGTVYIGGAVNNPGYYPVIEGDSLNDMIQAAGGITNNANPDGFTIHVPERDETIPPQRIDLNRAERWLLMALPGIGATRAQAIIDYRQQHGPFRNVTELTQVTGIGTATYQQIEGLITVGD